MGHGAVSSDAEFFAGSSRPLGRIPSSDDVPRYADTAPNKRDMAIERLLYSSEFSDR